MDEPNTLSNTADTTVNPFIPSDTDGNPIKWDGNDASIEGILYEIKSAYERGNLFQPLFKHRATLLSSGKLAVDSVISAGFVTGLLTDPYKRDFDSPAPPSPSRYDDYEADAILTDPKKVIPKPTSIL